MKRIILAIVMTACISQISAQVRFGLKGGVNFENFNLKNEANSGAGLAIDNSTGWQAGALLQVKIPGLGVGVQPELLYTVLKANVDDQANSVQYFEVPINLRLGLNLLLVRPF